MLSWINRSTGGIGSRELNRAQPGIVSAPGTLFQVVDKLAPVFVSLAQSNGGSTRLKAVLKIPSVYRRLCCSSGGAWRNGLSRYWIDGWTCLLSRLPLPSMPQCLTDPFEVHSGIFLPWPLSSLSILCTGEKTGWYLQATLKSLISTTSTPQS